MQLSLKQIALIGILLAFVLGCASEAQKTEAPPEGMPKLGVPKFVKEKNKNP